MMALMFSTVLQLCCGSGPQPEREGKEEEIIVPVDLHSHGFIGWYRMLIKFGL